MEASQAQAEMVQVARRHIGTPFLMWGRDLEHGIDCAGIIALPAQQAGISCDALLRRPAIKHRRPLRQALEQDMVRIPISEASVGDVLWFCTPPVTRKTSRVRLTVPSIEHLALVSDVHPLMIIHASVYPSHRRVVEHSLEGCIGSEVHRWSQFIKAAYRFQVN